MVNVEILSGESVEKQSARMLADNAKGIKVLMLTLLAVPTMWFTYVYATLHNARSGG